VLQEAVQDGRGGRDVAEELGPVLSGAVGGDDGGEPLVAAHDDVEQILGGRGRSVFIPKSSSASTSTVLSASTSSRRWPVASASMRSSASWKTLLRSTR
jgi:hypothetical protein